MQLEIFLKELSEDEDTWISAESKTSSAKTLWIEA